MSLKFNQLISAPMILLLSLLLDPSSGAGSRVSHSSMTNHPPPRSAIGKDTKDTSPPDKLETEKSSRSSKMEDRHAAMVQKIDSIAATLDKMEMSLTKIAMDESQSKRNIELILRHLFYPSCEEFQSQHHDGSASPSFGKDKLLSPSANAQSNIVTILPHNFVPVKVRCESGWTVILSRESGKENFTRKFTEYEAGFGDPQGEHYIGNKALHHMTNWKAHQLRAELEDFSGKIAFAVYNRFGVGTPESSYKLSVGNMDPKSTAKDGLAIHDGMKFTTFDYDGDANKEQNCASLLGGGGGWWYNDCYHVLGTGVYRRTQGNEYGGISWWPWHHVKHSLKKFKLLIKPLA